MSKGFVRALATVAVGAAVLAGTAVAQPAYADTVNPGGIWSPAVFDVNGDEVTHDVFELDLNHRVVHLSVALPNSISREDLGGFAADGVAATRTGDGTQTVVVHGGDGAVWYRERVNTGPWGRWLSLGGRTTDRPSAAQFGGLVLVTVRGTDGFMYERLKTATGWTAGWRQISSRLAGAPAVAPGPFGFLAYVQGSDNRLWTADRGAAAADGWSRFRPVATPAGMFLNDPAVDPFTGHVYLRGSDAACWTLAPSGSTGWKSLGGRFSPGFAATAHGTPGGQVTVYGRGANHKLYYRTGGTGWLLVGTFEP